jgi:hypothetical protein
MPRTRSCSDCGTRPAERHCRRCALCQMARIDAVLARLAPAVYVPRPKYRPACALCAIKFAARCERPGCKEITQLTR